MSVIHCKYTKHLDAVWLMVVANSTLTSSRTVFLRLSEAGHCEATPESKRKLEHTLRHLHYKGYLMREKLAKVYHYAYDDACLLRPVTGLRFTKALELGQWTP